MRTYTIRERKEQTYTPENLEGVRKAYNLGHISEHDFAAWVTNYATFRGIEGEAQVEAPETRVVPVAWPVCQNQDFKVGVGVQGERTIKAVFVICSSCGHPVSISTE